MSREFFKKIKNYLFNDPRLRSYPKSVPIWILTVFLIAVSGFFVTEHYYPSKSIEITEVISFFLVIILIGIYFNNMSFEGQHVKVRDSFLIFNLFAIILFQNLFVSLLVNITGTILNFSIRVRRFHTIVFNMSQQLNCVIAVYWVYRLFYKYFNSSPIEFIILAFMVTITYSMLNSFQINMVIKFASRNNSVKEIIRAILKINDIFLIMFSIFCIVIIMSTPEYLILALIFLWVTMREQTMTFIAHQKEEKRRRENLNKMGNPLAVIDGYLEIAKEGLSKEKDNETIEALNNLKTQVDKLTSILTDMKK
ncbi:MAG: hypothetical protein ACTSYA_13105 [Candidatus Kariarchaeaceae archaeon]